MTEIVLNEMLTVDGYAAQPHTLQVRAVRAALAEGRIPRAVQDDRGRWMIPADAEVLPRDLAVVDTRPEPPAGVDRPRLADLLDRETGMLPLPVAARLLGVHPARIKEDPDAFEAKPWGERGALLVPQSFIRRIAGLA
jgi:hypothetical protein